ncbi:lipid-A-disaccharide synthase N-terminal domain-containing protein [Galbibacter mesophilus]|uniref:lipid-A-disaccharide synthase N-terminal domain-containing protein n=1 Tax=Galbibacter mesophilus TaxID=379069 RepID=UPI00191E5EE5|nr:lipid-A-disaccharide synthase N-terminal domain-containing protein [Galbibacter mesophilus]MCM5664413.1 lipid-A-disaccharide synthase N-terminal domain-containing protein [Galbibacter mesophilus]
MSHWLVYAVGFLAQLLFSGRLIFQWLASEKAKKVETPSLFWVLSLLASFLLFVYGWLRDDFAIMLGQTLTYFIYIRNLQLQGQWQKSPLALRTFLLIFPLLIIVYGYNNNVYDMEDFFRNEKIPFWLLVLGIVAQLLFTFRFIYQWMYSEKHKKSSLPAGFWILSLLGALSILSYAVFRQDPVLLVGHSLGTVIYIRNLLILRKQHD